MNALEITAKLYNQNMTFIWKNEKSRKTKDEMTVRDTEFRWQCEPQNRSSQKIREDLHSTADRKFLTMIQIYKSLFFTFNFMTPLLIYKLILKKKT